MVKLRTLLLMLAVMERGVTFPISACGVRPITIHCVSCNVFFEQ